MTTHVDWAQAAWFCRWVVGIAFAAAAVGKLRDIGSFRRAIDDFRLLPAGRTPLVAAATVVAECAVVALTAVGGPAATVGFGLALVLLAGFSVLLTISLRRDARVSCNCFGASPRRISWYDVARNAVLALGCAVGLWAAGRGSTVPPDVDVALVLIVAAASAAAIVTHLDDVVETLRRPLTSEG